MHDVFAMIPLEACKYGIAINHTEISREVFLETKQVFIDSSPILSILHKLLALHCIIPLHATQCMKEYVFCLHNLECMYFFFVPTCTFYTP